MVWLCTISYVPAYERQPAISSAQQGGWVARASFELYHWLLAK